MLKFKSKTGHRLKSHRQRRTRQGCGSIEPQIQDVQRDKENAPISILEAAKKNNVTSTKALRKDILGSVRTANHLHEHKTPPTSVSMNLGESGAAARPRGHLSRIDDLIRKLANNLTKSPAERDVCLKLCHASVNSGVDENLAKPFSPHQYAYDKMMETFCQVCEVDEVRRLFLRMKEHQLNPNVLFYNTVLNCLVRERRFKDVSVIYEHMNATGVHPIVSTYNILLKSCCYLGEFEKACQIFDTMANKGQRPDVTTYSTLIAGLSRAGRVDKMYEIYEFMVKEGCNPNVYTYTSLLQGLCNQRKFKDVIEVMEVMCERGYPPNSVTYNILINALCRLGNIKDVTGVMEIMDLMWEIGHLPKSATYNTLILFHCKLGNFADAELIFREGHSNGWQLNSTCHHIYVTSLCKAYLIEAAWKHLDSWNAGVVCYNNVMDSFCKISQWFTCLKILSDMVTKGVLPNTRTYNILVHSLCKSGMLGVAKSIVLNGGFSADIVTYNTLINEFYKVGKYSEAGKLFYRINTMENICPDVFTYSIMIKVLRRQGKCSTALHLFDKFLLKGLLPDQAMFSALTTGCTENEKLGTGFDQLPRMLDQGSTPNVGILNSVLRDCRGDFCCHKNISLVCHTVKKMRGKG